MKTGISLFLGMLVLGLGSAQGQGAGAVTQIADVYGQGIGGPLVAINGTTLIRTKNGITISLSMPTPEPFTYAYPPPNQFQAVVLAGSPEVFTGWIFFFNDPDNCLVPNACIPPAPGTPAPNDFTRGQGGVYNFSGHASGGNGILSMLGHISVGEAQFAGPYTLQNPFGAEVHVAIAPHGMLQPANLPSQFNTPIGGPPYWWLSLFLAP